MTASSAAETVDVAIVGARCAGSSAAIAFARAGRRAVMLDRASFPADTISTHLLWPGGVAELGRIGALERVRALGAPPMPEALAAGAGLSVRGRFSAVDGIDHALCVRRPGLDHALVETAKEAGAELRERVRVIDLIREGDRVAGVRYVERDGEERLLRARLVVGADGRRSTVARLVGTIEPYRSNANQRACFYAYFDDPRTEWRGVAAQWRDGAELATAFPCDGGKTLVLLMPPVARAGAFQADLDGEYRRTIERIAGVRGRLDGCELAGKVRSAVDTTSYFRRSSGAGWALPGDAGHFKDPVTAQGIRDALRFGRMLGETTAPALDEPRALDSALLQWERRRERECLAAYQWTNLAARAEAMSPIEIELYRWAARKPERTSALIDVFSRTRSPAEALPARLFVRLAATALVRGGADRAEALRTGVREVCLAARDAAIRARARVRPLTSYSCAASSWAITVPVPGDPPSVGDNRLVGEKEPTELPPGWVRLEVEPISPGGRRTADELMVARGKLTRAVVARRALDLPAGSRIRSRLLVSAIRGGYSLIARRDYEAMLRGYAENCELVYEDWFDAGPGGLQRGRAAIAEYLRGVEDAVAEIVYRPEEIVDPGGPTIAGRVETTIVGRGSGIELHEQQGILWTVHDGLIARQHVFRGWAPALAELKRIVAAAA